MYMLTRKTENEVLLREGVVTDNVVKVQQAIEVIS
jgi:hypothetical protein